MQREEIHCISWQAALKGTRYLSVPNWISRVADDSRPSFLAVMRKCRKCTFLAWLNGHL